MTMMVYQDSLDIQCKEVAPIAIEHEGQGYFFMQIMMRECSNRDEIMRRRKAGRIQSMSIASMREPTVSVLKNVTILSITDRDGFEILSLIAQGIPAEFQSAVYTKMS